MKNENEGYKKGDFFRFFGVILPRLPSLLVRLSGTLLKFKQDAKKGSKIFYKELRNQGCEKETAEALIDIYLETGDLTQYLQLQW